MKAVDSLSRFADRFLARLVPSGIAKAESCNSHSWYHCTTTVSQLCNAGWYVQRKYTITTGCALIWREAGCCPA